jgi:hypothetical protein
MKKLAIALLTLGFVGTVGTTAFAEKNKICDVYMESIHTSLAKYKEALVNEEYQSKSVQHQMYWREVGTQELLKVQIFWKYLEFWGCAMSPKNIDKLL